MVYSHLQLRPLLQSYNILLEPMPFHAIWKVVHIVFVIYTVSLVVSVSSLAAGFSFSLGSIATLIYLEPPILVSAEPFHGYLR